MVITGITVDDTDSLDAAADLLEDAETWVACEECAGTRSIVNYSPGLGYIEIECPACDGQGSVLDLARTAFDPEHPSPVASRRHPRQPVPGVQRHRRQALLDRRSADRLDRHRLPRVRGDWHHAGPLPLLQGGAVLAASRLRGEAVLAVRRRRPRSRRGGGNSPTVVLLDRAAHCRKLPATAAWRR